MSEVDIRMVCASLAMQAVGEHEGSPDESHVVQAKKAIPSVLLLFAIAKYWQVQIIRVILCFVGELSVLLSCVLICLSYRCRTLSL